MRKIKFRAWDVNNKTWTFVTLGDLICGACTNDGDKPLSGNPQIWEQSTGLKDKNGKEIYEGDIVKVEGDSEIYRVEWIRSGFGLEPRYNSPRYPILGNVELHKKIKVIGNIHENPELLEEK